MRDLCGSHRPMLVGAADACQGNSAVVGRVVSVSFLEEWGNIGMFPIISQTCQISRNFRESPEIVHDIQVSRKCYKISQRNLGNLIYLSFFCQKNQAFGVNPRDVVHRDLKYRELQKQTKQLQICLQHIYQQPNLARQQH